MCVTGFMTPVSRNIHISELIKILEREREREREKERERERERERKRERERAL